MSAPADWTPALGTPDHRWAADPRWDEVPTLDLAAIAARHPRVVVATPHPDDETLGAGASLARLAALGARVTVLVASDGEGAYPDAGLDPSSLGRVRRAELRTAVGRLAPGAAIRRLTLPDGRLAQHREGIRTALSELAPDLVLAPRVGDGHPDHDAVACAAEDACCSIGATLATYGVWTWHWGDPDDLPWGRCRVVLPGAQALRRRDAALRAYRSQRQGPPGSPPVLPREPRRHWRRGFDTWLLPPDTELPLLGDEAVRDRAEGFARLYAEHADPWQTETSWYEERKQAVTLAALARPRYASVLDIGCGSGALSRLLADRADHLTALDGAAQCIQRVRAQLPDVDARVAALPHDVPVGPYDLIVISEVGYFLDGRELWQLLRRCAAALAAGGELLLCHWRHPTTGVPLDGDMVHRIAADALAMPRRMRLVEEDVRLEVWGGPASVHADRTARTDLTPRAQARR